ncbi:MAG: MFS transporter [Planctomycetes bacterium]|nr:MFS transporter [Planctomycetota bacterium]
MPASSAAEPGPLRRWFGLAAFYTATFGVLAVYMQFFPVWLKRARSLTEADVAIVMSGQTLARTLAGPFWSHRVDRFGRPRAALRLLAAASLVAFASFWLVRDQWLLWLVAFVFGCLYPPMHPILDALALQQAHRAGFAYGRIRMVGSLSFLLVILAVGWSLRFVAIDAVFVYLVVGLATTTATGFFLPAGEFAPAPPGERVPWWALLRSKPFVLLLAASALIQGSHGTYYNLSTLHWSRHGIADDTAAVLWAEGILAEIVLFAVARRVFDRFRPTTLMAVGGFAAVVRWIAIGVSTDVAVLAAFNWLHSLSFALTFLGALRALERRVPEHQRTTAQGLLGAASSGIGMFVATLVGGVAYERWAGRAFFVMAAFALFGAGLAVMLRHMANKDQRLLARSTSAPPA